MLTPAPARFTTGLLLALPELAEFTSPWRSTSYAPDHPGLPIERRFPPHITLLTPWASAQDDDAMSRLRSVAARHQPLDLMFADAEIFDGSQVVWLRPATDPALDALLADVLTTFAEFPPYEGAHPEPTLHLTVSADGDRVVLDQVRRALQDRGPLRAPATRLSVFARGEDDVWSQTAAVPLGAQSQPASTAAATSR
ncbi:2'-5' RNA ligase family protein [Angustibacter sp. McL0619]|uniref:2'-5' RNA ligase family protein n=1 Tax=Angustibacter sp. McL0619 TaxID=3415676 RepID=UPI003CE76B79